MTQHKSSPFSNPSAITTYVEEASRRVPGLMDLHRMTMLLLAEHAPVAAHILIVGAGGGMETKSLAEEQPDWRFTGIDPSLAMLDLARRTLSTVAGRVELLEGTIDQAPLGPFDGAACILTLHHIKRNERLRMLREIRRRLRPGASLVVAEHSAPGPDPERWMMRSVAFGDRAGIDWAKSAATAKTMTERLPLLTPSEEKDLLREAGYSEIALFYAAFSFRGWVATS
jgi:tRNA (cmo5U34)-methyltransferase